MSQTSYSINHNDAILGMLADSRFRRIESMICKEAITVGRGVSKVVGADNQIRLPGANLGVLSFDIDFEASNVINLDVNGVAISPETFASDQATTIAALAVAIALNADVSTAVVTATKEITITGVDGTDISITNVVVTAGSNQAVGTFVAGSADSLFGIVSLTQNLEGGLPNTDVAPFYPANALANTVRDGALWVYSETAFNPDTDSLYCRFLTNSTLLPGNFRNDADSGKAFAVTGNYSVRNTLTGAGLLMVEINKPN